MSRRGTFPLPWWPFLFALIATIALGCSASADDEEETDDSADALSGIPSAKDAANKLKDAENDLGDADQRLTHELAHVSMALTSTELHGYVRAFNELPDVRAKRAAYMNTAIALDKMLAKIVNSPSALKSVMNGISHMENHGRGGQVKVVVYGPSDLYSEYVLLAHTPVAGGALRFASHILRGDKAYANVNVPRAQVVDEILSPALPHAMAQGLAMTGSAEGGVKWVSDAMLSGSWQSAGGLVQNLDDFRVSGRAAALGRSVSVAGRSLGGAQNAAGVVLGVYELGLGTSALSRKNFMGAFNDFATGGPAAATGVIEGTTALRVLIRGGGAAGSQWIDKVSTVSSAIGAGVGLLLTLWSTPGDLENLGTTSGKVQVLGDLLAIAGGVLGTMLPAAPFGPIVTVVAMGAYLLAGYLHEQSVEAQQRRDEQTCLKEIGIGEPLRDTLVSGAPPILHALDKDLAMLPLDIQWLAETDGVVVRGSGAMPVRFLGLTYLRQIFRMSGAEVGQLLRHVVGTEHSAEERMYMVDKFLRLVEYGEGLGRETTPKDVLAWIDDRKVDPILVGMMTEPALYKAALTNAHDYLAHL